MPAPAPLRATSLSSRHEGLPVLDRSPPLDAEREEPRSPHSPELVDRAQRRRTILETAIFSPHPEGSVASPHHHVSPPHVAPGSQQPENRVWIPTALKAPVMIANIVLLVVIAAVLEALLKINRDHYGWGTPSFYNRFPQIHIIWTYVPGLIALALVWQWSEMDRYVKILQPYIDMSTDRVPAEKSVLLNYAEQSKWFVWIQMVQNKHITPFVTNTLIILCIGISPLFSSFLYLQQPPSGFLKPLSNITVIEQLGFRNPSPFIYTDAAAAFMKTSSLYDVGPPPFIRFLPAAAWTSTRVALHDLKEDGTVKAHTVCLRSMVSCEAVSNPTLDTARSAISGSTSNCTFSSTTQGIGAGASTPFGMSLATCPYLPAPAKADNSAVAFWVMGGSNGSTPIATICTPKIAVQRADVLLNTTTSALLLVDNQTPLLAQDENSDASLSSAPFNGSALNGLFFTSVTGTGSSANLNSTQFSLGQAIVNLYQKNDSSLSNSATFELVVSNAYAHYLGILAQSLYFQPLQDTTTDGKLHLTNERLFISAVVTHVLTALLLVMALGGLVVLILHRKASRHLALTREPGTLAAAIALGGASDMSHLLRGKDTEEEMRAMLADLQFTIDPTTGRLVVQEGEGGYSEFPKHYVLKSGQLPVAPITPSQPHGSGHSSSSEKAEQDAPGV